MEKDIDWCGTSREDLRAFPDNPRREIGYELRQLQRGEMPSDWRPFAEVGPGVIEIRVNCADGWFRVMYVAKFEEAIYVLHCFQKDSRKTRKSDVNVAKARYSSLIEGRRSANE